jgi:FKBP-type peptidyl-prolyl cis-trans isomerase
MLDKKRIALLLIAAAAAVAILAFSSGKTERPDDRKATGGSDETSSGLNRENSQGAGSSSEGYVPEIDGVVIEVLRQGSGDKAAKSGDTLQVHYVGTLEDGTVFDSSVARNKPFAFIIGRGNVIQGWDRGLMGMKVGEKRKLTISPEMGYGAQAVGKIPANSTLIFEVELLDIK